jgi:hypothetical protein
MIHLQGDEGHDFLYALLPKYARQIKHRLVESVDKEDELTESFFAQYYIVAEKLIEDLRELQRRIRIRVNEIKLNEKIDSFGLDE